MLSWLGDLDEDLVVRHRPFPEEAPEWVRALRRADAVACCSAPFGEGEWSSAEARVVEWVTCDARLTALTWRGGGAGAVRAATCRAAGSEAGRFELDIDACFEADEIDASFEAELHAGAGAFATDAPVTVPLERAVDGTFACDAFQLVAFVLTRLVPRVLP